jgi:hypothetical protein
MDWIDGKTILKIIKGRNYSASKPARQGHNPILFRERQASHQASGFCQRNLRSVDLRVVSLVR